MFNFFKSNYFLGIDFGTASIKVVELVYKDKNIHLHNYGQITIPVMNEKDSLLSKLEMDDREKKIVLLNPLNK